MQKTAGPEKFSFYLISRIDAVKMRKNWFLSKSLEFEASAWSLCFIVSMFLCFFYVGLFVSMFLCFYGSVPMFLCTLVSLFRCLFLSIFHVSIFLCFFVPCFFSSDVSLLLCLCSYASLFLCFFFSFFRFSEGPLQSLLVEFWSRMDFCHYLEFGVLDRSDIAYYGGA